MEETVSIRLTPTKQIYYNDDSNFGVYTFETNDNVQLKTNTYKNYSIKGKTMKLNLEQEYNATLVETYDAKNGYSYEIKSIYQDIPSDINKQRVFLSYILTENQVENIYKTYPDTDIVALIKEGKFDYSKVKGVGESSFQKIKDKIIENTELHQAIEFLGEYNVSHNMIIKLVDHFNSASLLIQAMEKNPYCITEVSGIGFKKADAIAMSMEFNPNSKHRIVSAIEYVVDEESGNGHTYVDIFECIKMVYDLIGVNTELISMNIKDTKRIVIVDDRIALKRNHDAEKYIAKRIKELNQGNTGFNFDVDQFINKVESEHGITLTDQQKSFFHNVKKCNFHLLVGYAGSGKSNLIKFLIQLLEEIKVNYKMLSPTGKAAKVLNNYTNREVETVHRGIGLGRSSDDEGFKTIDAEYIIVDETSMLDATLCAKLLYHCTNENVKVLFIGDSFQIPSVGSGNILHDLIESNLVPKTMLDIIFRQKEGGILDIATKVRQKQKFVDNDFVGIKKFGNNCVLVSVPQEKMVSGYKHFLNELIKKYSVEDITIVTPTKKGELGTFEINKHVQSIVNPSDNNKTEKEYGFDKTVFRQGDLVINTKNTYKINNIHGQNVSIVNGDIGKVQKVDIDNEQIIIDFGFDTVPFQFNKLKQLLHAWTITKHKCVTGDTWVYSDKGILQLNELNNNAEEKEFKDFNDDILIYNGNILERAKSFYNNGIDEVVKIKTQRGYELKCTKEHGIDILNENGDIVRVDADELTNDSLIVLAKGQNVYGDKLDLPTEWQNRYLDVRSVYYNRPSVMTKEFARFLGYMVADGTIAKNSIRFSKRYIEVTESFKEIVEVLFGYTNSKIRLRDCGDYIYEVSSADISGFCENIEGLQPHNKYVPKCIMSAPREYQCEFLKGVFEDGTVNIKKDKFDHIELSMKEKRMCEQIKIMLLNMGIVSSIAIRRSGKDKIYTLYIYKNDAKLFADNIGFVSEFKQNRLQMAYALTNSKNSCQYVIPNLKDKFITLIDELNMKKKDFSYLVNSIRNNRFTPYTINRFLDNVIELNKNIKSHKDYKYLRYVISDNVYFEKIKDITYGHEHTYCLEMPESHKFVQNGIHAYNSQGSASKAIIAIADKSHKFQLSANLVYTAFTRPEEMLIIITQADTLNFAIRKVANLQRRTFLQGMLKGNVLDD